MKLNVPTLSGLILLGGLASQAPADVLHLKSGDRREGRVEEIAGEPDYLLLLSGPQHVRIPKALVERVEEQTDAEDYTILGEQLFRSQSYERAIRFFQQAMESDPSHAPARQGLERARAMIAERQAEAERRAIAGHSEKLAAARRLLEAEQGQDFAQIEALLNSVAANSPSQEQKAAAELVRRDLYLAWAQDREDKLDRAGAEDYLSRVLAIDPSNEPAQTLLMQVWRGDPARREQLLGMVQERLSASPDDLALVQEYATLLMDLGRDEEAIAPLLKMRESGRPGSPTTDQRLERALTRAAERAATAGKVDRAIELYRNAIEVFPDYDPSPLYRAEYRKRLDALEPADWKGRAELLEMLVSQGMTRLAIDEAEVIVQNDPANEKALALLRRVAEEGLRECQQALLSGRYSLAMNLSRRFAQDNTRFPDLVQVASDIYNKASIEAERLRRRTADQARELVAYGDENLSLARRNLELYKSAEDPNRTNVLPYKFEAIKYAERAVQIYNEALKVDPSVGQLVGGLDVHTKIQDAETIKTELNRQPRRVFLPQSRR